MTTGSSQRIVPVHKMPLCDCADHGAFCRGRQEGRACMARDKWFTAPCDEGRCPGPMHPDCCHKGGHSTDEQEE